MSTNRSQQIYTLRPVKSPSPDLRNKNRIANTSFQLTHVKKYLQTIKNHHKQHVPGPKPPQIHASRHINQHNATSNEQRLRKRIYELEIQNNQFRIIAQECHALANRNQQLEEQMILLLNEIENNEDTSRTQQNKQTNNYHSKHKQHLHRTEESSPSSAQHTYSRQLDSESHQLSSESHQLASPSPFADIVVSPASHHNLLQENYLLRSQSNQIKQLVDEQIKKAMAVFEAKFIGYINAMELKLAEMQKNNEEISKLQLQSSEHSQSQKQLHPAFKECSSSDNHNSEREQIPPLSQRERKQSQISLVRIELEQSNASFGKSKLHMPQSKLYTTPEPLNKSNPELLSKSPPPEPQFKASDDSMRSKFTNMLSERVFNSLEVVRQNLTYLLGQKSRQRQPQIQAFQKKCYLELKNILEAFFPRLLNSNNQESKQEQLIDENHQMRLKIQALNQDIEGLKKQIKLKVDQQCNNSPRTSELHFERSYFSSLPAAGSSQQFEETERRLIRIIQIMKSFNEEYQNILTRSRALSLQHEIGSPPIHQ